MKKSALQVRLSLLLILVFALSITSSALAVPRYVKNTPVLSRYVQELDDMPSGPIDKGTSATVKAKAQAIVAQLIKPGMDDFQKALVLHDWIVYNTRYDYKAKARYTAEGPLLHGRAVCAGYAKAYQLLCTEAKLQCKYIVGLADGSFGWGSHGWNMVRMDDDWYHVDCTWDDPTGDIYGTDPAKSGAERHNFFGLTDTAIRWDHKRWRPATKCTAIKNNHNLRMGLLDDQIRKSTSFIQQKLDVGIKTFQMTPPYNDDYYDDFDFWTEDADYEIMAAVLSARSWNSHGITLDLNVEYKDSLYHISPKPIPIKSLAFNTPINAMVIGTTQKLAYTVLPAHATNTAVTWSSSNKKILSVDQDGVVTARKAGSARITMKAKDGSKTKASILIKVTKQ